ncbi:hypothetical protein UCRPC4_g02907 [Phaeomoniella chlamydospora]|uniref:Glycosyltransferase family 69 protein n=1 Tax=Phaeomoniella chlamydospora TaxID=158046 RepID=A0A0G2EMB1_PHACM|nr:hypothetical protein UCRPC4_g02907 [Phaeomoniella chlamydospora]
MVQIRAQDDEYELRSRDSVESKDSFDLDAEDPETRALTSEAYLPHERSAWAEILSYLRRKTFGSAQRSRQLARNVGLPRRRPFRRICFFTHSAFLTVLCLAIFTAILRPSYTHPPERYNTLRQQVLASNAAGRANPQNEKIFIAASIFDPDGELAQGPWSKAVLGLIDILGPDNVFLSIYENNAGTTAREALESMGQEVGCQHELIFDENLDPSTLLHFTLPDGTRRVKRITYLAEVRNRALKPLELLEIKFDKILYLNDVIFDPIEAAHLLFLTKAQDTDAGRTDYRAACAVDFINPFKFYDTFATRDSEGYSMGLPFYPWFTDSGRGRSRQDVLAQKDAVMVKSCWGGMVAFDAKYFQFNFADKLNTAGDLRKAPAEGFRFRAEEDLFWDASECCLIHADIQSPDPEDSGIYLNPYVRVAYDERTLSWLGFTRRFERLYTGMHSLLNHIVGLPWYNPRRAATAGSEVEERVWVYDDTLPTGGSFTKMKRKASHAGYCGRQALQVMLEQPVPGQRPYEIIPIPT